MKGQERWPKPENSTSQQRPIAETRGVFLVAQPVKNLPAMRETGVLSMGGEDPLVKGLATHSSIHVRRIPRTEEPGGLQCMGSQELDMTE